MNFKRIARSSLKLVTVGFFLLYGGIFFIATAEAQITGDQLSVLKWREIGPSATGGRVTDIDADPNNPSTIYVASASGGLWKTENNGTTWKCIFEKEGTLSIGDIALDYKNPKTIWVGSGEANNQRSSIWGDGIYKTVDGGKTWTNTGLPETHHIGRIVIDPRDSNVVYVAALGHLYTANEERGLYKTTDGGKTWEKVLSIDTKVGVVDVVLDPKNPDTLYAASYQRLRRAWNFDGAGPRSAIYKSTDAGKTWKKLKGGLPTGDIGRIGLTISPRNPYVLYAAVSNQNTLTSSEKQDLGAIKKAKDGTITTGLGLVVKFEKNRCSIVSLSRGSMAGRMGIRRGNIIEKIVGRKIATEDDLQNALKGSKAGDRLQLTITAKGVTRDLTLSIPVPRPRRVGGEIYKTEDGGLTWKKQNKIPVGGTPAYYYGQIRIDPLDDNRLYVLSVPVMVSSDGGKNWSRNGASSVHVDHHAMWINPNNSNLIMLGNDGGFQISYDRSKKWDYISNLPMAQFYAITVDMQKPYHVYGGLQDNGSWGGPSQSRSGSVSKSDWYRVGGGDGFYVQVDPNDHNNVISESQFGVINRFHKKTSVRKSIRPPQSDPNGAPDRYNWNSPILRSRHDSRTIYFGGNKLFKSYNRGDDWIVISPDLSTANPERIAGNVPHCTITTIAESKFDRNMLLVGTDDGNVQWTIDGGKNWTNMADRFPKKPVGWWCTRVELSSHDRNVAYASFSAFREDDFRPFVFITKNGGATWESIIGNLPTGPVNVIKEDPVNPNALYLGSEFGAFVSMNRGTSWIPLTDGLPRVSVHDMVVHTRDKDLVIGTHGRGIFVLDIAALQSLTVKVADEKVSLLQPQDATLWRRGQGGWFGGDRKYLSPNPQSGAMIYYYLKEASKDKISLSIEDRSGKTVRTLKPTKKAGLNRVIWDLRPTSTRKKQPGGRRGRRFGRFGRFRTPPVTSGSYTAVLKVGQEEFRKYFSVKSDAVSD